MKRTVVVVCLTALFLSVATAGAAHLITGRQIAAGTITGANVKDHSLSAKDFKSLPATAPRPGTPGTPGANGTNGASGVNGAVGATGAAGIQGPPGANGQGATTVYHPTDVSLNATSCPGFDGLSSASVVLACATVTRDVGPFTAHFACVHWTSTSTFGTPPYDSTNTDTQTRLATAYTSSGDPTQAGLPFGSAQSSTSTSNGTTTSNGPYFSGGDQSAFGQVWKLNGTYLSVIAHTDVMMTHCTASAMAMAVTS